ncbi:MAG: hypothetical protein AAFR52_11650 [Pseudomonadota bacterium]
MVAFSEGLTIKAIVPRTGCSRQVVRRVLRGEREAIFRIRQSSLDPWHRRLDAERAAGCEARRRARATPARRRFPGQHAGRDGEGDAATPLRDRAQRPPRKRPSARAIARMMARRRDHLTREEAFTVVQIDNGMPRLTDAAGLIDEFQTMIRNRQHNLLDAWLP